MHPVGDRGGQQFVPGRVELEVVDAVTESVVGPQNRRVLVREPAQLLHVLGSSQRTEAAHVVDRPFGTLSDESLNQSRIVGDVVAVERYGLIEHFVGLHDCFLRLSRWSYDFPTIEVNK